MDSDRLQCSASSVGDAFSNLQLLRSLRYGKKRSHSVDLSERANAGCVQGCAGQGPCVLRASKPCTDAPLGHTARSTPSVY